jgi:hypothetical protein
MPAGCGTQGAVGGPEVRLGTRSVGFFFLILGFSVFSIDWENMKIVGAKMSVLFFSVRSSPPLSKLRRETPGRQLGISQHLPILSMTGDTATAQIYRGAVIELHSSCLPVRFRVSSEGVFSRAGLGKREHRNVALLNGLDILFNQDSL